MKSNHRDFLLEINTEELPAGYVVPAMEQLREAFIREFLSMDIEITEPVLFGTKNCLVCYIKDMPPAKRESLTEISGPPKRIAFDDKGAPTRQAVGFAKNHGVRIEDLKVKKTPKGEYIVIEKKEKSREVKDIIKEIIPRIIKDIHFPKTMKWDDSGLRFARPIESVLALFGNDNVEIRIGCVPRKRIKPVVPAGYLKRLRKTCLIDAGEREARIRNKALGEIKKLKGDQVVDKNLLREVTFMVNSPEVFVGEFNGKFLSLPADVLRASMAKHQRVFPVSKKGKLINKFIAVIDGAGKDIRSVRKNYENILEAKLKDSLFFFDEDLKKPLSENIGQLKNLIFQKGLGNMFEKIERLKALCSFACDRLKVGGSLKNCVKRAAGLSKADLVTHMVGEFPSLQGTMGGEYALRGGEKEDVALAIKEHYLPRGAEDDLPKTKAGAILAICDKIDNVVGFLGTGSEISGSFDPFGIRRNTQGFIQVIKDNALRFDVEEIVQCSIESYGDKITISASQLKDKILNYIKERIVFLSGRISRPELKDAVLEAGCGDIVDAFNRISGLSSISAARYFLEAAKVVERTSNILKGAKNEKIGEVDERLFKEDLERSVWAAYLGSRDNIQRLIDEEKYDEATREYARVFFKTLHEFFDKVMVNAEDKALRLNRLAMMKAINRLYAKRVANLALLPQIVV